MVALEDAPEPIQDEIDNQREEFRDYRPHGRILGSHVRGTKPPPSWVLVLASGLT